MKPAGLTGPDIRPALHLVEEAPEREVGHATNPEIEEELARVVLPKLIPATAKDVQALVRLEPDTITVSHIMDSFRRIVSASSKKASWSEWSSYSACSVTCGRGTKVRTRSCEAPPNVRKRCLGVSRQRDWCHQEDCIDKGDYDNALGS